MAFWQYLHSDLKWTHNYDKSKNNVDARWRAGENFLNDKKGGTSQPNTGLAARGENIYEIIQHDQQMVVWKNDDCKPKRSEQFTEFLFNV